jgi:predicted nucleotidyltransferase
VLQLLRKSNTTPFEWLQSPVVYREDGNFKALLWDLCQCYFSQRINTHHYLGIAKGAMDTVVNVDEIKIKKLFYVLHPLLSAKWCLEKNQIAPMEIGPLMGLLPEHLQTLVSGLIVFKATGKEATMIKIPAPLKSYIDKEFINCTEAAKDLPKNQFDLEGLNHFFIKTINEYDDTRPKE